MRDVARVAQEPRQRVFHHLPSAGRCVHDRTRFGANANMPARLVRAPHEYERAWCFGADLRPTSQPELIAGVAGQHHTEGVEGHTLHESRAVDASAGAPAEPIWHRAPGAGDRRHHPRIGRRRTREARRRAAWTQSGVDPAHCCVQRSDAGPPLAFEEDPDGTIVGHEFGRQRPTSREARVCRIYAGDARAERLPATWRSHTHGGRIATPRGRQHRHDVVDDHGQRTPHQHSPTEPQASPAWLCRNPEFEQRCAMQLLQPPAASLDETNRRRNDRVDFARRCDVGAGHARDSGTARRSAAMRRASC